MQRSGHVMGLMDIFRNWNLSRLPLVDTSSGQREMLNMVFLQHLICTHIDWKHRLIHIATRLT